ncbi:cytidylate kinase [mine drainage metagenome]|uniref:Cytidylate kinase n=1 Tax=mine drainage metagenome TaxID=410659 RepID=A0A1J5RRV3_9ZZZZ
MTNILNVISAMAEVAAVTTDGSLLTPKQPVVTISRDYGSGGDVIATRLAQRLGLSVYDDEILRAMALRLKEDPAVVRQLDEGLGRAKDMWLYRLFSGKEVGFDAYRDTLIKLIMSLGRLGGVIVGRGAHLILADARALRIRIIGTPTVCAARMAAEGHGTYEEQLVKARETNHRRERFVHDMFGAHLADVHQYDVIINTDRMDDFEDAVEMLVLMAEAVHNGRMLGLKKPEAAQ